MFKVPHTIAQIVYGQVGWYSDLIKSPERLSEKHCKGAGYNYPYSIGYGGLKTSYYIIFASHTQTRAAIMGLFWSRSTKCLRSIRNIVQIFAQLVLPLLLSLGGNKWSNHWFFSLIWRQKYSLYWFIHSTTVWGTKSLCADVDLRSLFNQSVIVKWVVHSVAGLLSSLKGYYIITSDVKHTFRNKTLNNAESHHKSPQNKWGCQHVACLPLDWLQLHKRLLSSHCALHNVQENCLTWSEQLGAIWLLTSFKTIDFYLISDELMFSECHYCERVSITLRFTSNSLSSCYFILAD